MNLLTNKNVSRQSVEAKDIDEQETKEWLEALDEIIREEGPERGHFILEKLITRARESGAHLPYRLTTAYINTIPTSQQPAMPGDQEMEWRIRSIVRWNAAAMVLRANKLSSEYGGHIASYASAATLYDVGYNHFWRAPTENHAGDLVFVQGHSAPGIYSRAFLLDRLSEEQLDKFRQEVDGGGLSSYPHPWLMPDFWQFPTVSMGLGPIMAIYQARFLKYMMYRELLPAQDRKVWAFMGDGEMDEPESLGAIGLAGREKLDNLVFVINCNLQRLDGPVRGNGKIIQELDSNFRGAGWNVIKVIWGSYWDPLLSKDANGTLKKVMEETVDGEYQNYKSKDGAFVREKFFGKHPELKEMVAHMSDEEVWRLNRGGHDPHKVYAAYHAAVNHKGQPTVILAKTIKGYGMGNAGQGLNATHQAKKMDLESLKGFRDKFRIPISDEDIESVPYFKPGADSPEIKYMREQREKLGGFLPARRCEAAALEIPSLDTFSKLLEGTGDREISTTMAFVRILTTLVRDKIIGHRVVPIVPDEARTFGMEGLFRQIGIWSSVGQLYEPEDADQLMYYREDKKGQVLEEGINEAGAFSSWIAAATSYTNHNEQMIPFYIYYSMFGFQRVGDLAWCAGDMQARGFLLGGTAGRTTLAGEGLQHQDGHSHLMASTIPNCISYDPSFAFELAVIIHDGMRRMFVAQENIFYYISVMNENYSHPAMPKDVEDGILKGLYKLSSSEAGDGKTPEVQLMGCGTILRECMAAAEILENDYGVAANIWSATSFNELRRDGLSIQRWNTLHPESDAKIPYITQCLEGAKGPVIAATDYMKIYADQVREFIPNSFHVLGTDGFGRSDSRAQLRKYFEVDAPNIVIAALKSLCDEGEMDTAIITKAIKKLGIDPDRADPATL